ncbi:hypothetical protein CKAN_00616000 [Cinnamomum micranthum f. kanehirae]|uniref:Major facilitator superfamily domain-containing protein 12-like n=1 Tax=Cinnamomum micranthum f. kanehirae TaxID=337451 RepID=A0A3S3M5Z2_9MAGN|nr:hypothetical protein CKAN_00616000 [Cinnamomum micranthum f. kanehirae]
MIVDMEDELSANEPYAKPLQRRYVFYYGVGHMLNDITSACWFTYLLLFLTEIGLTPRDAAIVMLSGQFADGIATIVAGELIDRFGHFKLWHAGGSVLVAISFSSVFGGCLPCKILGTNSSSAQTIGYSVFAAIFNVGWAATQVSHMEKHANGGLQSPKQTFDGDKPKSDVVLWDSFLLMKSSVFNGLSMVNCITRNPSSRVALASCRNAFTMVANLSLYAIALAVFNIFSARTTSDIENQYLWIACLSIFLGCCFVVIFLAGIKEPRLQQQSEHKCRQRISWTHWFKKTLYYQVALVYLLMRLVTNVSQTLLAFYVINDLQMAQYAKALVPAVIYICSFVASVALQEIKWTGKRLKIIFTVGAILWVFSGAGILFLPSELHGFMYLLSIIIGVANALMTVTGISMESVLVGEDLNGCAFVYGSLSFLDKISCGIALYVLESYQDTAPSLHGCNVFGGCISVSRYGLALVPGSCAILGAIVAYTMDLPTSTSEPLLEPLLV